MLNYRGILFVLFIKVCVFTNVFGTAQVSDLLIYNNDTLGLYTNPLETYYNKKNPRPKNFGFIGCENTACWRDYQAIWELKDGKLYLLEIRDCCFWETYILSEETLNILSKELDSNIFEKIKSFKNNEYNGFSFISILKEKLKEKEYEDNKEIILKTCLKARRKADLYSLFGEHYKDGKVFAFWFTGKLTIPKGKLIKYIHMGYMSKYEKEHIITIKKGLLVKAKEYENKINKIKKGYGLLQTNSYSMIIPISIIPNKKDKYYTTTDTINYSNKPQTINLTVFFWFHDDEQEKAKSEIIANNTIDFIIDSLSFQYDFKNNKNQQKRWGIVAYGFHKHKDERLMVFTISNTRNQMIVYYKEQKIKEDEFIDKTEDILRSIDFLKLGSSSK